MQIFKPCLLVFVLSSVFLNGCSSGDETPEAVVNVNGIVLTGSGDYFSGEINGDFAGSGGNISRTFNWENLSGIADYTADITMITSGIFMMVVKDASGDIVLDRTLNGAVEPDSLSGVTSEGTSGIWSVTIILTDFNGSGSFSLREGT